MSFYADWVSKKYTYIEDRYFLDVFSRYKRSQNILRYQIEVSECQSHKSRIVKKLWQFYIFKNYHNKFWACFFKPKIAELSFFKTTLNLVVKLR